MDSLSATTGVPAAILEIAIMLLSAYPLALIYASLNLPETAKHLFSIFASCSLFLSLFPYVHFVQVFASATISYLVLYFGKGSQKAAQLVFIGSMVHLSANFLAIQVFGDGEYRNFDVSAVLMVLVIKLSSFGWHVHDGTRPEKELNEYQKRTSIKTMPSLIEYYGYVFFFAGFLIGPAITFHDYITFVKQVQEFREMPPLSKRVIPTLKCFGVALACFAIDLTFSSTYDFAIAITPEYLEASGFLHRFVYMMMCAFVARQKYYAGWKMSEGACILAGVGFNGFRNGEAVFDRVENVDILRVECPENPKQLIDSWNKATAVWLKNEVYNRLTTPGKKAGTRVTLLTFLTSAFWHGFYPGYYGFFVSMSFLNSGARYIRRYVRPLFTGPLKPLKGLYDIGGVVLTMVVLNVSAAPFNLLTLENTLKFWSSLYFFVHIMLASVFVAERIGLHRILGLKPAVKLEKQTIKEE